ncbi:solute carrier family 13 member 2 isoform X3 [Heterocephalus glaber]|uniref:Solute carrier family 13 member 2 isoform X3 n=1 Tax=Heterocephalus glaber TaxID=10181 RepID=A0AAX6PPU7_HETGA|nr:solute carrier family 13 member 2 isoform X3 [Heterocephalus glaber]
MTTCWQGLWAYRSYLIVLLLPIILLPLPILIPTKEAYCAYAIILMALFWCTEALPLAVTAFFPLFLFPLMGIMEASEVSTEYLKDTNILFIGGLIVAIAVEHWNLHKRIALRALLIIGVRPALLILGFMMVTAFLSMWISNTATTAMMVPIAHAVLEELQNTRMDSQGGSDNPTFELQDPSPQKEVTKLENGQITPAHSEPRAMKSKEEVRFSKGMSLCVAYSASIGGIATLTGTTPNLVMQGQMQSIFPENPNIINFASWFGFAFPTMVILLLLAWLWLQFLFLGFNFKKNFGIGDQGKEKKQAALQVIKIQHKLLGPMNFAEKAVTVLFVILVVLWFTREPGFFPGWGNLAFANSKGESMPSDGTVAMFISVILFIVPSKIPGLTQDPENPGKLQAPPALLTWKTVNEKMPWNIMLLLGAGFALAKGSEAQAICLHPLYIMLPCTLASSLAFMLPVATPPNAIVFSFGGLKVTDMARAGFLLNIIGVLVIMLAINTWSFHIFNMHTFPSWAQSNATQCFPSQPDHTTASP